MGSFLLYLAAEISLSWRWIRWCGRHPEICTGNHSLIIAQFVISGMLLLTASALFFRRRQQANTTNVLQGRILVNFGIFFVLIYALLPKAAIDPALEKYLAMGLILLLAGCLLLLLKTNLLRGLINNRWFACLDYAATMVSSSLILMEATVFVWGHFSSSPLALEDSRPEMVVKRNIGKPGDLFWGFPNNSLGFYDREFSAHSQERFVANLFSDSFGHGIVPHSQNFVTLAEQQLNEHPMSPYREARINNMSVIATGLQEYLYVYLHTAKHFSADLCIICIFVGNDIGTVRKMAAYKIWDFSDWGIFKLSLRVMRIWQERRKGYNLQNIGKIQRPPAGADISYGLEDEKGSMSEETFYRIEFQRFSEACELSPAVEKQYRGFLDGLDYAHRVVQEPLLIVLIPDEFQVNDQLYAELIRNQLPSRFDRFQPQKKIMDYCWRENYPVLNLLPALQEGEQGGHCYHLSDTHWNARGNAIAGQKLAQVLSEFVQQKKLRTVYQ